MRTARDQEFEDTEDSNSSLEGLSRLQKFSVKQTEFLHAFAATPYASEAALCREVGIPNNYLQRWKEESPHFKQALEIEYRRSQQAANMNRKTVMRGMLEAIAMAKDMRQPSAMITGYKEIARMCGYYEPERREIHLSVDSKKLLEQIQVLPKEKLLELWREHEAPAPIDTEFEVVDAT